MGFYIPSFIQKRILRYALSRFDLLDTDALALDSLDIAWGKRSTFELRDVSLRQDKLAALLRLPSQVAIHDAQIRLLRLTIPADIHTSGIRFEAEGVSVNVRLDAREVEQPSPRAGAKGDRGGPDKDDVTTSSAPDSSGVTGGSNPVEASLPRRRSSGSAGGEGIPTTADLAQSFVDTEPAEERAQLAAAVAKSHSVDVSLLSESLDLDSDEGYGSPMSLPGFVADFLEGVKARAEAHIKDVQIDLCIRLDMSSLASQPSSNRDFEDIRLRLCINSLEIHPLKSDATNEMAPSEDQKHIEMEQRRTLKQRRSINIAGIRAIFLSGSSILSFMAQFSGPPSPAVTHASSFKSVSRTDPSLAPPRPGLEMRELESSLSPSASLKGDGSSSDTAYVETSLERPNRDPEKSSNGEELERPVEPHRDVPEGTGLRDSLHDSFHEAEFSQSRPTDSRLLDDSLEDMHSAFGSLAHSQQQFTRSQNLAHPFAEQLPDANEGTATSYHGRHSGESSPGSEIFRSISPVERRHATSQREDLTASRIFSHEEAASMYQSAISQAVSGSWSNRDPLEEDGSDEHFSDPQCEPIRSVTENPAASFQETISDPGHAVQNRQSLLLQERNSTTSAPDSSTNMAFSTPSKSIKSSAEAADLPTQAQARDVKECMPRSQAFVAKEFFSISSIDVEYEEAKHIGSEGAPRSISPASSARGPRQIPGGFSTATISLSDSMSQTSGERLVPPALKEAGTSNGFTSMKITIGPAKLMCDMFLLHIAALLTQQIPQILANQQSNAVGPEDRGSLKFDLYIQQFDWQFVSQLKGEAQASTQTSIEFSSEQNDVLLQLVLCSLSCSKEETLSSSQTRLSIGNLTFGYQSEPIISFDSALKLRDSVRDTVGLTGHDITITLNEHKRAASEITIMTLPLHIQLNLTRLDDTFSWIGGLSGILELGNSMISTATVTESTRANIHRLKAHRSNRNVRFEGQEVKTKIPSTGQKPPAKFTARIGGLAIDLIGSQSSVTVDGTAVKIARRGDAIRVNIDRLNLKGPILPGKNDEVPVHITLDLLKLVYLQSPKEDDLDRLLALLAPSRDYEESTGDIILDTFLRQRRQGTILRANVQICKTQVKQIKDLDHLSILLNDLAKLAPVANYLPEDDRPGLLTLAKIEHLDVHAETSYALGAIKLRAKDIEVAHVSLPSILLLGIDFFAMNQNDLELLGPVIETDAQENDQPEADNLPMVHLRLIGDEMDPTLKINLRNLRVEYHISTIMSLLGLSENASGEVVVNELVNSVATLTAHQSTPPRSDKAGAKTEPPNPTKLEIDFRDCAIGLNPRRSPARGLLHLTNVKFLGTLPQGQSGDMDGNLTIAKAALLLIDNAEDLPPAKESLLEESFKSGRQENRQLRLLRAMGYVSVSELSTASVSIKMVSVDAESQKSVEVVVRDDLIVLETCADSTQTLISILNGLQPPLPPNKELKYRTEVVPVQNMLASLSGNDFTVYEDEASDVDYSTSLEEEYVEGYDSSEELDDDGHFDIPGSNYSAAEDMIQESEQNTPGHSSSKVKSNSRTFASLHDRDEFISRDEPLQFQENHFAGKPGVGTRRWDSKKNEYELIFSTEKQHFPLKFSIRDVHVIWNLFDGYDWPKTRDAISQAVAEVETKAADMQARRRRRSAAEDEEDEPVIEDFLFNSIYIGIGNNQNPRELARNINRNIDDLVSEAESYATTSARSMSSSPSRPGAPRVRRPRLRLQRSRHHKMTFELKGLCIDFVSLLPGSGETQTSTDVRIRDLDIFDHVPTSTWKKFATYMQDAGERETGTNMIHLELLNVRPIPELAASEIIFKATILPLRLHVDQDALDFLTRFFEFRDDSDASPPTPSEAPFIQRAEVNSVPVKLDFKPKRVDYAGLRSGKTTEFMNFMILDSADMVLRHVIIYGVSGFDRLGKTLNDIWMPDIKRNQLPGVLAGLAPVRPLVNVGAGVRDLIAVPVREYRKDGRVIRSIQKGAFAFAKTTTTELAKLGAKVAMGTHTALQTAEEVLSPRSPTSLTSPSTPTHPYEDGTEERPAISPYADLPIGVVQGLRGAYRQLERDLLLARDAIVAIPGEVMESGSAAGAAKAIARGAPTVILRPALGVTKAVGQTLMGAATTLDKEERRRIEEKYKRH